MTNENRTTVEAIAKALEVYLESRPLAADTLEGIATWWLSGEVRGASLDLVETAVERLCRSRLLHAERHESGVIVYRAARGAAGEPANGGSDGQNN